MACVTSSIGSCKLLREMNGAYIDDCVRHGVASVPFRPVPAHLHNMAN